jgi:hypothetical protein
VAGRDGDEVVLETALGRMTAPRAGQPVLEAGQRVLVAVPRGSITLGANGGVTNADVAGVGYYGWYSEVLLRLRDGDEVTARVEGRTGLALGDTVTAHADAAASVEPEEDAVTAPAEEPVSDTDGGPVVAGRALA